MNLIEVEIQNFLSFGEKQTVPLSKRGLVGVLGENRDSASAESNGSGKSSILEAIRWCLSGTTLRGLKGNEVVNKKAKKNCKVALKILDSDNNTYVITRTQKYSAKKPNDLIIEINGIDAATRGIKTDTQVLVYQILGMNINTFNNAILLTGKQSFCAMTDSEQKGVLEDILQVGYISRARDVVRERIKSHQTQLAALQLEIERVKASHHVLIDKRVVLVRSSEAFNDSRHDKIVKLYRDKAEIESSIEALSFSVRIQDCLKIIDGILEEQKALRSQEQDLQVKQIEEIKRFSSAKAVLEQKAVSAETTIRACSGTSAKINSLVNIECPTCTQLVESAYVDYVLSQNDNKINALRANIDVIRQEIGNISATHNDRISKIEKARDKLKKQQNNLQNRNDEVKSKIREHEASLNKLISLEAQSSILSKEISKLQTESNPFIGPLEDIEKEISDQTSRLSKLKEESGKFEYEIKHLLFWDYGFSNQGLKSYIMDTIVPFLNDRAQYYADILSGGDLKISFNTQKYLKDGSARDEFNVSVVNSKGAEAYKGTSDGERRRVDIAVGWALGDLAATRALKPIKFRALDEPFENLDESGEQDLLRLLNTVLPNYETIFIVSHSASLKNQLPSEITVIKENGFSRINHG